MLKTQFHLYPLKSTGIYCLGIIHLSLNLTLKKDQVLSGSTINFLMFFAVKINKWLLLYKY